MKNNRPVQALCHTLLTGVLIFSIAASAAGQQVVKREVQFNGYTNHWHNTYDEWYRYGNLFKMARSQVEHTILQSKVDVAEDLGIPGLLMEEGFMNGLLTISPQILDQPTPDELTNALSGGDVLVLLDPGSEAGSQISQELPPDWDWPYRLGSHQYGAKSLIRADLFRISKGDHTLYVVSSGDAGTRDLIKTLLDHTRDVLDRYNLHKGWFGAFTLHNSVTCTKGHPLEVIGTGMNEGNSWFVFDGYMDFMLGRELDRWMEQIGNPALADVGFFPIYGCSDYEDLQVQQLFSPDISIDYARNKGGYVFRQVWDDRADSLGLDYDGYLATEGNKEQIDSEEVPFILKTGPLSAHALNSMVLFIEKEESLTKESMWEAIMDRRATGVLEKGLMLGPARYRNVLQMLLLDRIFLEDYFGDRIDLKAEVKGNELIVTVNNFQEGALYGDVELVLPGGVSTEDPLVVPLDIMLNSSREVRFTLKADKEAMGRGNPLGVSFNYGDRKKQTMAVLDMPPAISVHQVLYGHAPLVKYPVSVHNFGQASSFPVEIQAIPVGKKKARFKETRTFQASTGSFQQEVFDLQLSPGNYIIKVSALGTETTSQLGVGKDEGKPQLSEVDLNGDGVMEYRLENEHVQVTLITTGARVIEYIVKSRNDNVLYKWWPNKAVDDRRPFRKRGFYPFGGFEDFLGQASMETHEMYHAEILQQEGDYVQVKMWADYFGNRLEKIFTLYGDSPLLEVRFALDFQKYPEANMLGPQPILSLGEKHWTEDLFVVPEKRGLKEYRMKIDTMYGEAIQLKEGWNAGYDTEEDVSFVGAFPVDQPIFLHMWMNTDQNRDSHHFYTEFQPWLRIDKKNITYFSYYLWGAGGSWENGVEYLRNKNLISQTKKP
jgi:hypothetical protein